MSCLILSASIIFSLFANKLSYAAQVLSSRTSNPEYSSQVECIDKSILSLRNEANSLSSPSSDCLPKYCYRRVVDGIFSDDDIQRLHAIAKKGMSMRSAVGGPTILDINTGFIRDSVGLENLFARTNDVYSAEDFEHYGRIIGKLREHVMQAFSISQLYFTAPTFITRIDASQGWEPKGLNHIAYFKLRLVNYLAKRFLIPLLEIHDEYWHAHADHNNTDHYFYSGLLYMSTYNEDFTGGRLKFLSHSDTVPVEQLEISDESSREQLIMEPRRGRVVIFSSGYENTHRVEKVLSGQRFVLSFWFTCDPKKEFEIFLDGQSHVKFSQKIKQSMIYKNKPKPKHDGSASNDL